MAGNHHPNRSKRNRGPGAVLTPDEICALRDKVGLTQKEAGNMVFSGERSWQDWESGARRMHPAWAELFRIKTEPRYLAKVINILGDDFREKLLPHLTHK